GDEDAVARPGKERQVANLGSPTTQSYQISPGRPHPLGATPDNAGTNFAVFSREATAVQLLLFESHDSPEPFKVIDLDPTLNRTFYFWHVYVNDVNAGMGYAYRVDGPRDLHGRGHRFNPNKVLIDPYARGVTETLWDRVAACGPEDNLTRSLSSVVVDVEDYDWEGDRPINRPMSETVIYEMHVKGFTQSPSSGAEHRGKYVGLIDKIPYLQRLGVTAVELLPVFEFDEMEISGVNPITGQRLINYWGYSPIAFFSPHGDYCVRPEEGAHINEFRDMVKALHKAGIEVILDVVFNHTGEGNHQGPTISFRGFDNATYYHLEPNDKQYYTNMTGCGNTFNCNHPMVVKFINECLLFWVRHMHIDGFRFDLASILSRGEGGHVMDDPPVLWHIELDDEMADTKIIAEAWDAAGLYQVGYFPGYRWAEWNGRYRDDIRRFVKGDKGIVGTVASRIAGSADLYQDDGELPINSINFITAHDGFTLNDLVSYNEKHNEANGENNNDGTNDNLSWNHGVEGETDDRAVNELRSRQVRNFLSILMLSQGVPMMLMGDESRQTQFGNNNAYCQDNEMTWLDWDRVQQQEDQVRFTSLLIDFRKRHPNLRRTTYLRGDVNARGLVDLAWHGCQLDAPGWHDAESRVLAFTLGGFPELNAGPGIDEDVDIHVMMNMDWQDLEFELPTVPGRHWYTAIDTGAPPPGDIAAPGEEVPVSGSVYNVRNRSVVALISK
ncbi:MAG: glycogen debranching protein GlgX, partial [Aeromicrobium sp.]